MASGPKYYFQSKIYKITAVLTKVKIGDKRERFILLVINLSFAIFFFLMINDISISIFTRGSVWYCSSGCFLKYFSLRNVSK
jgi:hypothetical protein